MRVLAAAPVALVLLASFVSGCGGLPEPYEDAEVTGAVHRFMEVEVDGLTWHYVEAGAGPTVVLLHGMPEGWHGWRFVMPYMASGFRLIVPDLKGFGQSDKSDGDYSIAAVAAELGRFLTAIGVDRFALVGHDWGGFVAARLAGDSPQRIERYAHVSSPYRVYDIRRTPDYNSFVLAPDGAWRFIRSAELFLERIYEGSVAGGAMALPAGTLERHADELGRSGVSCALGRYFRDFEIDLDGTLGASVMPDWAAMTFPVMVVTGDSDYVLPSEGFLEMAEGVPGFSAGGLRFVDDSGHYPALEQPEQLAALLTEFFAE